MSLSRSFLSAGFSISRTVLTAAMSWIRFSQTRRFQAIFSYYRHDDRWRFGVILASLMAICAVSSRVEAQETTLRFEAWPTIIEVTFNPDQVPTEDLRQWMEVADYISNENGYQVPLWLEQCFKEDPRYAPCGPDEASLNINNAQLNLDKIRTVIANLESKRFPVELSPVVSYLRRIQTFALWRETQRLKFVQTGNLMYLESPFENIDPKTACKAVLDQLRNVADKEQASGLARHDWENCVWHERMKQIGQYPQKAWETFLAAHGIRERISQEEIQ